MGTTTNYSWIYPTVGASSDTWGTTLNNMAIAIDSSLKTVDDVSAGAAQKASNLSDLASVGTARTNLGLGSAATQTAANPGGGPVPAVYGSTVNNIPVYATAEGSLGDSGIAYTNIVRVSNNLSDVTASTARTNLGLGSIATRTYSSGTGAPSGGSDGDLYGQHA